MSIKTASCAIIVEIQNKQPDIHDATHGVFRNKRSKTCKAFSIKLSIKSPNPFQASAETEFLHLPLFAAEGEVSAVANVAQGKIKITACHEPARQTSSYYVSSRIPPKSEKTIPFSSINGKIWAYRNPSTIVIIVREGTTQPVAVRFLGKILEEAFLQVLSADEDFTFNKSTLRTLLVRYSYLDEHKLSGIPYITSINEAITKRIRASPILLSSSIEKSIAKKKAKKEFVVEDDEEEEEENEKEMEGKGGEDSEEEIPDKFGLEHPEEDEPHWCQSPKFYSNNE